MTCRFLSNFSFEKLIAPVSADEFFENYWERKPLVIARDDPTYFQDLFNLRDFDQAIAYTPTSLKTFDGHSKAPGKHYAGHHSSEYLEGLLVDMSEGRTLVLDGMHHRAPSLDLLCRLLASEFDFRFQTNIYLSPPNGKGFPPHTDRHDVFVLQTLGSKNWRIDDKRRRTLPRAGKDPNVGKIRMGRRPRKVNLRAGDLIYLPRGYVHDAVSGSDASMHITLGWLPTTWEHLLNAVTGLAAEENPELCRNLPRNFIGNPERIVGQLKTMLADICDDEFLNRVVSQFSEESVTRFPIDFSGQVESHFNADELSAEDKVGPRRALIYKLRPDNGAITMLFGGRQLTFPDFLEGPLRYCLNTTAFKIKTIPGDLADSEKVVVVERLMQEGLLVRK